jgi:hypothetical protein
MNPKKDPSLTRRDLLKTMAWAGSALGMGGMAGGQLAGSPPLQAAPAPEPPGGQYESMIGVPFARTEIVRVGLIGCGGRGTGHLSDLLAIPNVQVTALCDIVKERVENGRSLVEKAGQKTPAIFLKNEWDFENLNKREDIDLVYIATPWDWHFPMLLSSLNQKKHVAVEVPAVNTLDECWKMVEASEQNRRHCLMIENCCYGYNEMLVLTMVRAGLFGDLTHGEAAYIHNLRSLLLSKEGEGLWRRFEHIKRDGNIYPTHGLGPVAQYMDINRGDRFDYMVSMSSLEKGLTAYRAAHVPQGDPSWKESYKCGDINTSLIKTVRGRTIMLQHDVINPRTYDRLNMITGTKGTFRDYPPRIYFDGDSKDEWGTIDKYKEQYEHPLWKKGGEMARKMGGHGGMDYIMNFRLIQCLREGLVPDMDVYDGAAWTAPAPLSELSVAQGSAPFKFPDFTRGKWQQPRRGA